MKKVISVFFNNNLDVKERKYNNVKLIEIFLSVIFIIYGIVLFSNNILNTDRIESFLGIIILLYGILDIYSGLGDNSNKIFKLNILFGILYLIIAIMLFTNFIKLVNSLKIYYGVFLIISGIKQLSVSIRLKMVKENSFLLMLVMSILVLSLGGLLVLYPFQSFDIIELVAIFSILFGLLNINASNLLRNRVENFLSKVDN